MTERSTGRLQLWPPGLRVSGPYVCWVQFRWGLLFDRHGWTTQSIKQARLGKQCFPGAAQRCGCVALASSSITLPVPEYLGSGSETGGCRVPGPAFVALLVLFFGEHSESRGSGHRCAARFLPSSSSSTSTSSAFGGPGRGGVLVSIRPSERVV